MGRFVFQRAYKCLAKMNRGYTLVELAITLAVILILSSICIYAYFGALAHARDTVCETNIRGLKKAVEDYVLENDVLPATLGHLKLKHVEKGYAKAMEEMGWRTKFGLFFLKLDAADHAYAQFLTRENLKKYGGEEKKFHCYADDNGLPSYGISGNLEGKKWSEVGQDEIIVADCDQSVFTSLNQLAKRHRYKAFAVTKGGRIIKVSDVEHAADDSDQEKDADGANRPAENNTDETDHDAGDDSGVYDADADADTDAGADDDKVTICHNGKNTQTIAKSALAAHLAQGDTVGPCP